MTYIRESCKKDGQYALGAEGIFTHPETKSKQKMRVIREQLSFVTKTSSCPICIEVVESGSLNFTIL